MLVERGPQASLSVRNIAEVAGRSTMCVYTHYRGRTSLLFAMHDEVMNEVRAGLSMAADPGSELRRWCEEHPDRLLWLLTGYHDDELRERSAAAGREICDLLGGGDFAEQQLATAVGSLVLRSLHTGVGTTTTQRKQEA